MSEFDFNIGAQVHCRDGQCGRLARVVVDPDTLQITDIIVEEGFLLKRARVFPISTVESTAKDNIRLAISSNELANFREYREVEYETHVSGSEGLFQEPYPGTASGVSNVPVMREKVRQGISSDDLIVVQQGTPVMNAGGKIGKLDHVIVNEETNEITHLVIQQGTLFSERILVPVFMVEHVGEKGILIAPTDNEIKVLARYIPEEKPGDQNEAVEAGRPATTNPYDERTLSVQVAAALSADPRTRGAVIKVINSRGTITLAGQVESWRTRQAAVEITANEPGVVSVIDALEETTERTSEF